MTTPPFLHYLFLNCQILSFLKNPFCCSVILESYSSQQLHFVLCIKRIFFSALSHKLSSVQVCLRLLRCQNRYTSRKMEGDRVKDVMTGQVHISSLSYVCRNGYSSSLFAPVSEKKDPLHTISHLCQKKSCPPGLLPCSAVHASCCTCLFSQVA